MDTSRFEWVDIAKGMGIIWVIIGHTIALSHSQIIYTFHMPLFFFLSGMFFREIEFKLLMKKNIGNILKPWCLFSLFGLTASILIPDWRSQLTISNLLADLYTANLNVFQNSSIWYLVCYFWVPLLGWCMLKCFKKDSNVPIYIYILLTGIGLLYSKEFLLHIPIPFHRLPFKMDTAFIAVVFFMLAYKGKDVILSIQQLIPIKLKIWLCLVFFIGWVCFAKENGWTNLNSLDFGKNKSLFYPTALLGISWTILAAMLLSTFSNGNIFKRILIFYGQNTLIIFGTQSVFIRLYIYCINYITGSNMKLYGDNPMIHQIGSFIVVTCICSPLIVIFIRELKRGRVNKYLPMYVL